MVERFPGCVCRWRGSHAAPHRSTYALPNGTREEENIPGEARDAKGAEPPDKIWLMTSGGQNQGEFGSPQQAIPPPPNMLEQWWWNLASLTGGMEHRKKLDGLWDGGMKQINGLTGPLIGHKQTNPDFVSANT